MLVVGPNKDHIEELKAQLARKFEMKNLGSANKIIGMQIHWDRSNRKIWLSQKNYLKKVLSRFNMQYCKPISTLLPINFKLSSSMSPSSEHERMEMSRVPHASAMGSLMFAMICTRPDIAQAVGVVSRYMANPGKEHWNTVKMILRYIKETSNIALCCRGSNLLINGYVDSDYVGDLDKSKSTTGYVFKIDGGAVSWVSKLQSVVATSTTEAKYCNNYTSHQSALHLARNSTFHSRTKHIRVQYHFIREKVEEMMVDMQKIHTKDNITDFMMKAINADKFTWCRSSCGMLETNHFIGVDPPLWGCKTFQFRLVETQMAAKAFKEEKNQRQGLKCAGRGHERGMIPMFSVSCGQMIEQWKEIATLQSSCEIDIWPEFQKLTADAISRTAFGSSYEEGKKIFEYQKELISLTLEAMQSSCIPGKHGMRMEQERADDLLGMLFLAVQENTNGAEGMTIDDVIEECKQFHLAGQETTSSLLTWAIIVLALHQEWQEKARHEILQVFSKELNFEAISHLKVAILRLYPPVVALYQFTNKDTKIKEISLPAGVDITLPNLLMNHDPGLWGDDNEEFKPERFFEGVSKASRDKLAFFSFSWGPRTCIGQNFAMIEAKVALAMVLNISHSSSNLPTPMPHTLL
ncbi:putative GHMYB10 [Hibiscus syriacus]|uniref:GHMYB10 n=1 Tax=Hibiscus syriacus TaxID=106335 RepID=A0A6A3BF56_HIBSY|nr:putative GHMYB10 [Hibiscus syriacus]